MKTSTRLLLVCASALFAALPPAVVAAPKIEETIIGPTKEGGAYTCASNGAHIAYSGMKGTRFYVNVDGVVGPEFDALYKSSGPEYFFPQKAGVWLGRGGGMEGNDAPVIFSPDGKHYAYTGRQGTDYVVIHDGKEVGRFPVASMARLGPTLSPGGKFVYWNEAKMDQGRSIGRTVINGKATEWGMPVAPVFSPDDEHYAWAIKMSGDMLAKTAVYLDGKNTGYTGQSPVFTADSKSLLTISHDGGAAVLLDGKPVIKGGVQVSKIVVGPAGKRYAAIVRQKVDNKFIDFLYLDGKQVPGSHHAQDVWFSPDGKRYAAVCKDPFGGPYAMLIDGQAYEFARVDAAPPYWTPDSSKIIFTAGTAAGSVVVVNDDMFPYTQSFSGVTMPKAGGRFSWAAFTPSRGGTVVIDGKPALPAGTYPTSAIEFSPDGSRYGFLAAPVGRNEVGGVVLDGAMLKGFAPGFLAKWITSGANALVPFAFSPDGKHVAYLGRTAGAKANSLYVDETLVHRESQNAVFTTFTPDSRHLFWVVLDARGMSDVYVDGQKAVRANGYFFREMPGAFAVDADGVATFLAEDGDMVKRYRITPAADTSVATLLEKGATAVAAPPTQTDAAKATATAPAKPVVAAATTPTPRPGESAKPSAPAKPLTWADLVNHPERWPDTTKVNVGLKFSSGALAAGSAVRIETVNTTGAQLIAPQGFVFNIKPENCDLLAAANAEWLKFTPEQRDLTPQKLAADPTVWPGKVKILEAGNFGGLKVPAGTEWPLTHVKPDELGIAHPQSKEMLMFAFNYTDIFPRARELVLLPREQRPGRMAASLEGVTVDVSGKPAVVPAADYYVFYFAASTCPRCEVFTPKFVEHFNKNLAARKDVAFVSWPTDATTPPYLQFARQKTIPWPTLPVERKNLFANLGVFEIPGILVVDRFGNRILASNQTPGAPLAAAETTLSKLNDVLKPAR